MNYILLIGRILFSGIFIMTFKSHFSDAAVGYADLHGVPMPHILVPLSGVIAIVGGLMVATGFRAKVGAALLIIFLIPVSYYMHPFWREADPMQLQMQMGNFAKNMSLLGAAMYISYFGSGPMSVDELLKPSPPVIKGFAPEGVSRK